MTTMTMRFFSALILVAALYEISNATTILQQITAAVMILTAAVLWVGGETIHAVLQVKQKIEEIENGKCKETTEG